MPFPDIKKKLIGSFFEKTELQKLWKFFIIIFLISILIINWQDISWFFNYKFWGRKAASFIEKNEVEEMPTLPNEAAVKNQVISNYYPESYLIEIPKIGIEAPIVFSEESNEAAFEEALKNGVLYYPESVLPSENGATIILGHSAPPNWPHINYDWVFNDLNKLETGDQVIVYFNHQKFVYSVSEKGVIERGADLPASWTSIEKSSLVLLSCWPPGKDYKRYGVLANLDIF